MNIWIIYDSKFGNNIKIANALAGHFTEGNTVNVHYAKKISPKAILNAGIDMLIFGGPLRMGTPSYTIRRWASQMGNLCTQLQQQIPVVAAWGSHGTNDPNTPPQFAWEASKAKWQAILAGIPAIKYLNEISGFEVNPTTLEGPLLEGWEAIAQSMADQLKKLL